MPDRVFVSVAVSKPEDLTELPGAITAARRMATWASAHGYRTVTIDDSKVPVTVERIRKELTPLLTPATSRLIFFFAGHGSAKDANKSYWLLSNWSSNWSEAIDVSSFQRMLRFFCPQQVTVIGDCCRVVHKSFLDVIGSAVLDRPDAEPSDFELDRFFAADAGEQSFMIRAQGSDEAFCIFTEVVLDALEGDAPDAFELGADGERTVTSGSLTIHLKNAVPVEASRYHVTMKPIPEPGYYTDRVYARFPSGGPQEPPPALPGGRVTLDWMSVALGASDTPRSVPRADLVPAAPAEGRLEEERIREERALREKQAMSFRDEFETGDMPTHFETGAGLAVLGTGPVSVESSTGSVEMDPNRPGTWFPIYINAGFGKGWTNLLVDLGADQHAYVCSVRGFITTLQMHDDHHASVVYCPTGASPDESRAAMNTLSLANAGLLTSDNIVNTAAELRQSKHRDFTLGCVAAYLYDSIGDVESIRSIAAYYADAGQVVPLDVALLSGGRLSAEGEKLFVDIPATPARHPRTKKEERRRFTFEATEAFAHAAVAGSAPWMRSGWTAVNTAAFDDSAISWRDRANEVVRYLTPSPFTIVRKEGGEALANLVGIRIAQLAEA
jgi:hypothetical protein